MSNTAALMYGELYEVLNTLEREECEVAEVSAALCNVIRTVIAMQEAETQRRNEIGEQA